MSDNQGGKRVRIRDIAEALGVSTATVSNVIHNKTAKISAATVERVQKALDEFGYAPNMAAISLAQKYSPVVGVVVSATQRYSKAMLTDPFISHMLDSISTELEHHGYTLMLCRESDIRNIPRKAHMWNWAGAIFMSFPQDAYAELTDRMPIPFVAIDGGQFDSPHYATSGLDNRTAGQQAGEYLLRCGHTRIGFISDSSRLSESARSSVPSMRYYGLVDALRAAAPDAPTPCAYTLPATPEERIETYAQIYRDSLDGKISAIFSVADIFAVELINYLNDQGVKLPEALSIIGFDDTELATIVRPQLTTFRQDLTARGTNVVKMLLSMVESNETPGHIIDEVRMISRSSVSNLR